MIQYYDIIIYYNANCLTIKTTKTIKHRRKKNGKCAKVVWTYTKKGRNTYHDFF